MLAGGWHMSATSGEEEQARLGQGSSIGWLAGGRDLALQTSLIITIKQNSQEILVCCVLFESWRNRGGYACKHIISYDMVAPRAPG